MRVNAYIDGYNLYHAEVKLGNDNLKWVNLRALCQHFCGEGDKLDKVYYFTALAEHIKSGGKDRHKVYMKDFLEDFGVESILGYFQTFSGEAEEKQTDINIALQLFEDAIYDRFDKAILISADTDFIPAINKVKDLGKEILLLLPPTSEYSARFDRVIGDNYRHITKDDLANHLLPSQNKNGKKMPPHYLSEIPAIEQDKNRKEVYKNANYNKWFPFPQCQKCKDYLSYESYENLKNT